MPTDGTPRSSFRLRPPAIALIDAIAEAKGGLTKTRVVELALEQLGRSVLGRRAADLAPVRRRPAPSDDAVTG